MSELIYEKDKTRYRIDGCLPQRAAFERGKIGFHAISHGHYPGTLIAEDVLPGISSMGFIDAVGEQDWGMDDHRNEGIEICLQETGSSDLVVDGVHHSMPARTLSITRPWQLHRVGNPYLGPGRLHWIIVDVGVRRPNQSWQWPEWCILTKADLAELTYALRSNEHPVWSAGGEILRVYQKLAGYVTADSPSRQASRIMVTLNQLWLALLDMFRSRPVAEDKSLTSRRRTVELFLLELQRRRQMLETHWTIDRMARHCGMGRTAFAEYCHDISNTTPVNYLTRCRVESAARRLTSEPQTAITTIAFGSGFSSSQYFSRKFKEHYGMTPSEWRMEQEG